MHIQTKNCYNGQNLQIYKLGIIYWEQKETDLKYLTHFFLLETITFLIQIVIEKKKRYISAEQVVTLADFSGKVRLYQVGSELENRNHFRSLFMYCIKYNRTKTI